MAHPPRSSSADKTFKAENNRAISEYSTRLGLCPLFPRLTGNFFCSQNTPKSTRPFLIYALLHCVYIQTAGEDSQTFPPFCGCSQCCNKCGEHRVFVCNFSAKRGEVTKITPNAER